MSGEPRQIGKFKESMLEASSQVKGMVMGAFGKQNVSTLHPASLLSPIEEGKNVGMHSQHPGTDPVTGESVQASAETQPRESGRNVMLKSTCIISGKEGVKGVVQLEQSSEGGPTKITGEIHGLEPGLHGFHVHEFGDLSQGCQSAGEHFNPFNMEHGGPSDEIRHVGDLGNVVVDGYGVARINIVDNHVSLVGSTSVIGRALVVHTGDDDLGKGGHLDSKTTGHAGGRDGCGIIGIAQ
jgi:Cu-Zn family superoxide dismutase